MPIRISRRRFAAALFTPVAFAAKAQQPLWPGSRFTQADRESDIQRGLDFIYEMAKSSKDFADWGHDLLWCFYTISSTAASPTVRENALRMGHERAAEWRRTHSDVPTKDPEDLYEFVSGDDASNRLGVRDDSLRERVRTAAARFSAVDFLDFDPTKEPPPSDIPKPCPRDGAANKRGATHCARCGAALAFESRYEVWLDALVETYTGDVYGVPLGASYDDVLKWITVMRPYAPPEKLARSEAYDIVYAITHVVYTLNDYGKYRLSPKWLPEEFEYLRRNAEMAARDHDAESLGEFMDTLRAFGMSESDALIRSGIEYLLARQNSDGSWGSWSGDAYARYHTTWTAIDGLRQYAFQGERLRRPELMALIR
jgi:hypothetical protein